MNKKHFRRVETWSHIKCVPGFAMQMDKNSDWRALTHKVGPPSRFHMFIKFLGVCILRSGGSFVITCKYFCSIPYVF